MKPCASTKAELELTMPHATTPTIPSPPSAPAVEHPGLAALRRALTCMRSEEQGGYPDYLGVGKWLSSSATLRVTSAELNELFALAGVEPDPVAPLGDCIECVHSADGKPRSWLPPCGGCARPRMTNFKSKEKEKA